MSKDSSSKSVKSEQSVARSWPKAFLTTIAVIFGFLAAQLIGVVIFVSLLSAFGLSSDQIQDQFNNNAWAQLGAIVSIESLTIGLVYWYFKLANRKPLKFLKLDKKPTKKLFGTVALTYLLYFPVFVAVATLASVLIPSLDTEQMQQIGFENTSGLDYVAVFVALAILPPLVEEIVFRGILFQKLKQYASLVPAVLITSIIFGLAHLEFFSDAPLNWIAALDTFVFSLFLIGVFLKTNSLWSAILLHALKNSVAFMFLFLL